MLALFDHYPVGMPVPSPEGSARVAVWRALDLEPGDRRARAPGGTPPPFAAELVARETPLVVGRRRSERDAVRNPEGDGFRLALDQPEQPYTSKRHIELRFDGRWVVHFLAEVKTPAQTRSWGHLTWSVAAPGLVWPLVPGRPFAVLLPGEPAWVVTFLVADDDDEDDPVSEERTSGTVAVPPRTVGLTESDVETVVRSFRSALQWPPRGFDDDSPAWTGIRNSEALRQAYRRLYNKVREALGLPDRIGRGADQWFLERLLDARALSLEEVVNVARACDLDLHPAGVAPPSRAR